MADNTEQKNIGMADQAVNDISNAAQAGKAAATAAKAAAKAASGNVVGAAADLLRNEKTRQMIVVAILLPALLLCFIGVVVLYCFPLATYEVTQVLGDNLSALGEAYDEGRYSGDGSWFTGFFRGVANVLSSIWNSIFSKSQALPEDVLSEDTDMHIVEQKEAPKNATWHKITATKDKIEARMDQIKDSVNRTIGSSASGGSIYNYFYGVFASQYDTEYDNFLGVNLSFSGRGPNDSDALRLLCIYSVLNDQNPTDIKISDYLKWLGWTGGNNGTVLQFDICGETCSVSGWSGTFMPRYLLEESKQNPDEAADYSNYMCAAVDMILQVNAPSLSGIIPVVTTDIIQIPVPRPVDSEGNEIIEYDEFGNEIPPEMMDKEIHNVSFTIPITISVKGTRALMSAAGFISGSSVMDSLEDMLEQEEAEADTAA